MPYDPPPLHVVAINFADHSAVKAQLLLPRVPVAGDVLRFQDDPLWRDLDRVRVVEVEMSHRGVATVSVAAAAPRTIYDDRTRLAPVAFADKVAFESAMRAGKGCDVWPSRGDGIRETVALYRALEAPAIDDIRRVLADAMTSYPGDSRLVPDYVVRLAAAIGA